jgi:hypothetical protein
MSPAAPTSTSSNPNCAGAAEGFKKESFVFGVLFLVFGEWMLVFG